MEYVESRRMDSLVFAHKEHLEKDANIMSTNALVIHVEMKECVKMALEYFVAFVNLVTQVHYVKLTLTIVCQRHVRTVDTALTEWDLLSVSVLRVSMILFVLLMLTNASVIHVSMEEDVLRLHTDLHAYVLWAIKVKDAMK